MRISYILLVLLLLCCVAPMSKASEIQKHAYEQGVRPHKALYDIRMVGARSGSQILNISGQMFFELQQTCDAWVSNHRFNILYEYADSAPSRITSHFSTYEPFDGSELNFTSQRKRDGEVFEEIRGSATAEAGQSGKAVFNMPADLEFSLPQGTVFPIAHAAAVIEKIQAGDSFYNVSIFDGGDEDGPVNVNTFIGKPAEVKQRASVDVALDQALLSSPAHNIRMAFFPLSSEEAVSDYEMAIVYHENSLISDMVIEYDDFSVSQELMAVQPVEGGCGKEEYDE